MEILFLLLIVLAVFLSGRATERKQQALFRDKTSPAAEVRSLCMVRESYYEQPGAAQVLNGVLSIYTILGDVIEVPMTQVKLVKLREMRFLLGRYPWWGLTVLHLETPKTSNLALGLKDPRTWREVFDVEASV